LGSWLLARIARVRRIYLLQALQLPARVRAVGSCGKLGNFGPDAVFTGVLSSRPRTGDTRTANDVDRPARIADGVPAAAAVESAAANRNHRQGVGRTICAAQAITKADSQA